MKDEEILKKAIEKAVKNGYTAWWTKYLRKNKGNEIKVVLKFKKTLECLAIQFTDKGDESWDFYSKGGLLDWSNGYVFSTIPVNYLILSHDFAKAFWGTDLIASCEKKIPTAEIQKEYDMLMRSTEHDRKITDRFIELDSMYCFDLNDPEYAHYKIEAWRVYLPKLALAEDRIKYLSKFL